MINDHFHSFSKILPWLIFNFLGTAVRLKSWSNPCRRGPPAGCLREALHGGFSPWESIGWKHGVHWNLTVVESWYLYFACCTWFLGVFFPLCSANTFPFIPADTRHPICFLLVLLKKTRTSAKCGSSAKAFYVMFMKLVLSYFHRNHLILWYIALYCNILSLFNIVYNVLLY